MEIGQAIPLTTLSLGLTTQFLCACRPDQKCFPVFSDTSLLDYAKSFIINKSVFSLVSALYSLDI